MERSIEFDFLQVQGNPKFVRDERHVSNAEGENNESEGPIGPDHGIEQRVGGNRFPNCEANQAKDAENERQNDLERLPSGFWAFAFHLSEIK